jgi:hypothetical protein
MLRFAIVATSSSSRNAPVDGGHPLSDSVLSARLQAAVEGQVQSGAPGALARLEAPRAELAWAGAAGHLSRNGSRTLRPDDAFRVASTTKNVTAAVAVRSPPRGNWLSTKRSGNSSPPSRCTTGASGRTCRAGRHVSCSRTPPACPTYFREESFAARLREEPGRVWRPVDLVDHAAEQGTPTFRHGEGVLVLRHRVRGRPASSSSR